MRKLIVANWKENPDTEAKALKLFKEIGRAKRPDAEVVVCPPFIYLEKIAGAFSKMSATAKKGLALGAQDIFWKDQGAFTGEIGPAMIKKIGIRYAIVGHSERRRYLKETDQMINAKIALALKDGLKIILCVGEPASIRKKGVAAAKAFIKNQLKKDLKNIKGNVAVAYEPIWAIGSGHNDNPEDARAMAEFIEAVVRTINGTNNIKTRFLYGGSVNGVNAGDYIQYKGIDGALVGGASLKAAEFGKIINAATVK
jgi:triosephosphate isomerase